MRAINLMSTSAFFSFLTAFSPPESRSDDHDPVSTIERGVFGLGVHGLDCSSAATAINYTLAARTWFNRVISPTPGRRT